MSALGASGSDAARGRHSGRSASVAADEGRAELVEVGDRTPGLRRGTAVSRRAASVPFAKWEHLHWIEPERNGACVLTDEIHYRLPLGGLGRLGGAAFTRAQFERMFEYRHAVTKADLENAASPTPKCVLVSGASGLVGREET